MPMAKYIPHMKESKILGRFKHTAVRAKWFEVNNINHSVKDAPHVKGIVSK
jgi:hypothetical protein